MIKIKEITSVEDFNAMEGIWNPLLERSGSNHVQLTHEWYRLWIDYFGRHDEIWILTAEKENKLIGIAPLMIHRVGKLYNNLLKFRQLAFLGYGFQDRADFIITEDRELVLEEFFKHIIGHTGKWDEIHLRQISSDSPNFELIRSLKDKFSNFDTDLDEMIGCPYLQIEGNFDDYYQTISGTWRSKNEKNIRKLEREGKLEFRVIERITEENINQIIEIGAKRKEATGRRNIFLEDEKFVFIKEMIKNFNEKKWVKLFFLLHNDKVITYSLTFDYNSTLYRWNTSYDLDYSKYSVGRVLTKYMTEYCYANSYNVCDWMAGVEDHKFKWTSTYNTNYLFVLSKRNLKTKAARLYHKLKQTGNKS